MIDDYIKREIANADVDPSRPGRATGDIPNSDVSDYDVVCVDPNNERPHRAGGWGAGG